MLLERKHIGDFEQVLKEIDFIHRIPTYVFNATTGFSFFQIRFLDVVLFKFDKPGASFEIWFYQLKYLPFIRGLFSTSISWVPFVNKSKKIADAPVRVGTPVLDLKNH